MSKGLGLGVLGLGVVGLGAWGNFNNAVEMETKISQAAQVVSEQSIHGVQTEVFGRDIVLTGIADSAAERDALVAAATAVEGRRVVRDDLQVIPVASPYITGVVKSDAGDYSADGTVPTAAVQSGLVDASGVAALGDLPLASGAPANYTQAMTTGLDALNALTFGELRVTDTAVTLTGEAPSQEVLDTVTASVAGLEGDFAVTQDVTFVPTIDRFTLNAQRAADGTMTLEGFIPSEEVRAQIASQTGADASGLVIARTAPDGWSTMTLGGLGQLQRLNTGTLSVDDMQMTISGEAATDADMADVTQAVEGLAAQGGGTALAALTVAPPPVIEADMSVRYDRVRGLFVGGVAPADLSEASIAQQIGAPAVTGSLQSTGTTAAAPVTDALTGLEPFLPEFETVRATVMGEDVALEGTVLREADLDQIEQRLTDTGLYTSVALTRAEPRFNDGDLRPNALTGRDEVYQNGFWVPVVDISNATANLCDDATRAVFEGQSINFVTGSAQLDATSRSVIAELAGLVTTCFAQNAELTVIVQGHTDSVGSAESNQLLSRDRANAVVAALAERGIENARLTSIGFGESRPIADNDTEEGRAENRRTVLVWRD